MLCRLLYRLHATGDSRNLGWCLVLNFLRQFELPDGVESERISAELKHGVLTLRLPKKEQAKPWKIEVNVS